MKVLPGSLSATSVSTSSNCAFAPSASLRSLSAFRHLAEALNWRWLSMRNARHQGSANHQVREAGFIAGLIKVACLLLLIANCQFSFGQATNFGSVNVGSTAALTVTATFQQAGTLGTISVLTRGATGLDFTATTPLQGHAL